MSKNETESKTLDDIALLQQAKELASEARSRQLNYACFYFEMNFEHVRKAKELAESDDELLRSSFVYAMQ
ncbi:MAG: hypothetical protein JJ926_03425 [Roseitalea sp.]|nr:hypothetical protein [Roseitalea sp.]MBO6950908.1 hypothetical protein [Rhizobiaceae bacterium]MBO6591105.1 hypothetical protein [Roseitalea sp.]MBO6599637.1 hypothetical protein [Roseitalea sp.]MBO6613888.1 hypothetical protein [Roseitalea sp.]